MQVHVHRTDQIFNPDPKRVIARYSNLSADTGKRIIKAVMQMDEEEVSTEISQVLRNYVKRHRNITRIFEKNFARADHLLEDLDIDPGQVEYNKKILIGSYFTMEYSVESAAFFNPSIVEHPDQTELHPGEKRVILSFRATGEGHISSIVFRSGIIDKNNKLIFNERGRMLDDPINIKQHKYDKKSFRSKLEMMKFYDNTLPPNVILDQLNDSFSYDELKKVIDKTERDHRFSETKTLTLKQIMWLAHSHYDIEFSLDTSLSERLIFPILDMERNGIEDARFVKFTDDDGSVKYFATYTAYDGSVILPKMIETESFYKFRIMALDGKIVKNKGMAMFPRKINGKYAMLCRIDGTSNYISYSDDYKVWNEAQLIQEPRYPWEFIKIGNCGSPVETDEGWLVITHGVGQMREYVLGASLFDLDDPTKEIGRLKTPLMMPNAGEREGYVPNVIYSCGVMINNDHLIVPYGISDYASTYACIQLDELLHVLKKGG